MTIAYATSVRTPDDWIAGRSDFAFTDDLLTPAQEHAAQRRCAGAVTHLPVALDGTALAYNLPGVRKSLYLHPDLLASILLGRMSRWNDVRMARANPTVILPGLPIRLIYRSDRTGSTDTLTHYLSQISPVWQVQVGAGPRVSWPVGSGAVGSLGVVAQVLRAPGALGYVALSDALAHGLAVAALRNHVGRAISLSRPAVLTAADSSVATLPDDLQQRLIDAPGAGAYPLSEYVYVTLCSAQSGDRGRALLAFVRSVITSGQDVARTHYDTALPSPVQDAALAALKTLAEGPKPPPPPWCKQAHWYSPGNCE